MPKLEPPVTMTVTVDTSEKLDAINRILAGLSVTGNKEKTFIKRTRKTPKRQSKQPTIGRDNIRKRILAVKELRVFFEDAKFTSVPTEQVYAQERYLQSDFVRNRKYDNHQVGAKLISKFGLRCDDLGIKMSERSLNALRKLSNAQADLLYDLLETVHLALIKDYTKVVG